MSIRSELLDTAETCRALRHLYNTDPLLVSDAMVSWWEWLNVRARECEEMAEGLDDDPTLSPEAYLEGWDYQILEVAR
jgi:hypothetical protein